MKKENKINPTDLHEILEERDGLLFWKKRSIKWFNTERGMNSWNARHSGKRAFTTDNGKGYKKADVNGVTILEHRTVWAMHHNNWPELFIDHINMDKSDNRIENLRQADKSQNMSNRGKQANNTSGYKGVSFYKGRWDARIKKDGKQHWIGCFPTKEMAYKAWLEAAEKIHGEFKHG